VPSTILLNATGVAATQLPSCYLCGHTEKGCSDGVARMPDPRRRSLTLSSTRDRGDGERPLNDCARPHDARPTLLESVRYRGIDTRLDDADMRGKHRPGRVSSYSSIVGGNRGKRML
jgi:hypothetical protein